MTFLIQSRSQNIFQFPYTGTSQSQFHTPFQYQFPNQLQFPYHSPTQYMLRCHNLLQYQWSRQSLFQWRSLFLTRWKKKFHTMSKNQFQFQLRNMYPSGSQNQSQSRYQSIKLCTTIASIDRIEQDWFFCWYLYYIFIHSIVYTPQSPPFHHLLVICVFFVICAVNSCWLILF